MFPFPKIVCTSITGDNLRDNLWAEFKKWMRRSKFLSANFTWTKERIFNNQYPEEWWISARKWSKDADPEQQANALAGIHADYVLFILDESGGIPDAVAAAAEGGLATGKICKVIQAGNPTHTSGPLYRACMFERDLWWIKEINADPDNPDRAKRVSRKWAREQIRKYGRKSPFVMVNVLSQFPEGAVDTIFSFADFQNAIGRWHRRNSVPHYPRILGADIARFGDDINAIAKRAGRVLSGYEEWQGMDTEWTADRLHEIHTEWKSEYIRIDDVGVGGGVTDKLMRRGVPVVPVDVGEAPVDNAEHHLNLRSELYADFQAQFVDDLIIINPKIQEETTILTEGTTLKIEYTDRNKRKIMSKQLYRKKTGRSPNYLDAAMLAFADRVLAAGCGFEIDGSEQKLARGRFDPFGRDFRKQMERMRLWDRRTG
jgi:hypothetical protein